MQKSAEGIFFEVDADMIMLIQREDFQRADLLSDKAGARAQIPAAGIPVELSWRRVQCEQQSREGALRAQSESGPVAERCREVAGYLGRSCGGEHLADFGT